MRWPAISPTRATLITDCVGVWHINLAWLFGKLALPDVSVEAMRHIALQRYALAERDATSRVTASDGEGTMRGRVAHRMGSTLTLLPRPIRAHQRHRDHAVFRRSIVPGVSRPVLHHAIARLQQDFCSVIQLQIHLAR
jgi:hypothetical protein